MEGLRCSTKVKVVVGQRISAFGEIDASVYVSTSHEREVTGR